MNCPCCLQPVPDGSLWWLGIHLTHSEAQIMTQLNAARPFCLHAEEILAWLYIDRKSLGPTLSRLRAKIRPHGWTIGNISDRGKPGLYWLKEVA